MALLRPQQAVEARPAFRLIEAERLAAMPGAWDALVGRAAAPHPHYGRHVIEAHRRAGCLPADLAFASVWTGERLNALLPFVLRPDLSGLGTLVARPALSPFMPSSGPLVARDGLEASLAALVEGLGRAARGRPWRWPLLGLSDPVGAGLIGALHAAGWETAVVAEFERPVLDRRADHAAFLRDHPHRGRLKDLRRRQRRLGELGSVAVETALGGEALARGLDAFLDLEAAGWKGRAGTAMGCRPRTLALAHALFAGSSGPVGVRADTLRLDGRPLAVSLALVARGATGATACLLKTAYDETQRALAPGLVLEAEIVRLLHETGFADRLDAATLPGSALESLYPERERIAEIVAVPPGAGAVSAERRAGLARFEHRARDHARRMLRRP